jgi:hypothetical protein
MGAASLLSLAQLRSLPAASIRRKPLAGVKIDAATADEVEAAVALCASLRTRRAGVRVEKRAKPLEVCASANGPLLVSGGVRILDAEGDLLFEREKVALAAAAVRATNRSDTTARTRRTVVGNRDPFHAGVALWYLGFDVLQPDRDDRRVGRTGDDRVLALIWLSRGLCPRWRRAGETGREYVRTSARLACGERLGFAAGDHK